ncbi:MAG: HD domain-containing protein, partial [Candidatus Peribacteraceae bacterium]|nr:HD domain-containing protein [Candidatus Peribacteraceae bacterium]
MSYYEDLQLAALLHDIGKIDNNVQFVPGRKPVAHGWTSESYLRGLGFSNTKAMKMIRLHHKKSEGDPYLRKADHLSAQRRNFGGNTNKHLFYLPIIDALVFDSLEKVFSDDWRIDELEAMMKRNPWLDIVPADMNASLESQSLRQHSIQTYQIAKALWNEREPADLFDSIGDRKGIYELMDKAIAGKPSSLFVDAGVNEPTGELCPEIALRMERRKRQLKGGGY